MNGPDVFSQKRVIMPVFSREKERSAYLFADIPSDCVPAISPAAAKEIIFLCT